MSLSSSLRRALRGRPEGTREAQDGAAEALALTYAMLIDNAAPAARYRKALRHVAAAVRAYRGDGADDAAAGLEVLETALGAHTVASDLGPKLLAALGTLGMTPAGRGGRKDAHDPAPVADLPDPLDQVAAQRERRLGGRPR
jgi:hypothetical protein